MKRSIVAEKAFDFSLGIIALFKVMQEQREYVLSKQLLRSGTSIGANIEEARAAISKRDFVAKMSISSKEARETHYWLRLIKASALCVVEVDSLMAECEELILMLSSIVKSGQGR